MNAGGVSENPSPTSTLGVSSAGTALARATQCTTIEACTTTNEAACTTNEAARTTNEACSSTSVKTS